jgi:hypothetical protein
VSLAIATKPAAAFGNDFALRFRRPGAGIKNSPFAGFAKSGPGRFFESL